MNREERQKMVLENLPLVGYLVADLCARASHLSREDLAAVGAMALVASSHSFDTELGVPFGAYARRRILGAMADDLRASDWATRSARTRIKTTLKFQETLTADLGRQPTVAELAEALGVNREEVNAALADASRSVTHLDEGSAITIIADGLTPEESVLASEDRLMLRAAIRALPEKMRHIIEQLYFGDRTVKSLADELQITHSAVSQQRAEAMRLLRDALGTDHSPAAAESAKAQSRISATRRNSYLTDVSNLTAGGITRHASTTSRKSWLGTEVATWGVPSQT
jgi:RNA polymerase sigma factor for flagellar operon FliA